MSRREARHDFSVIGVIKQPNHTSRRFADHNMRATLYGPPIDFSRLSGSPALL